MANPDNNSRSRPVTAAEAMRRMGTAVNQEASGAVASVDPDVERRR